LGKTALLNATIHSLLSATNNTLRGLSCGARIERAVRQEMIVFAVAVPLGAYIAPSIGWYVAMVGVLLVTLAVEFLNTAIEKLADRVTLEHDARIGMAKDFGSAAVFCMLCLSTLIWLAAVAVRWNWFN
jgi:diacylglycerol kinase (ATP)